MRRFRDWSLGKKILGISISALTLFIIEAIISGIFGNSAYALFLWLWGHFANSITTNPVAWIITLVTLGFAIFEQSRRRISTHGLDTMNNIIKLDNSLLRLLPNLISANDQEEALKRLLVELLLDATRTFAGDVHRASIFLPDGKEEYLRIWAHCQMPDTSILRTQFYIGSSTNKIRERGVAGEAFVKQEIIVVHGKKEDVQFRFDRASYIEFDSQRPYPPYRSFVCVPILGSTASSSRSGTGTCLGVVCFDSLNPTVFDSLAAQEVLRALGSRIASVLLIYRQHLQAHNQLL